MPSASTQALSSGHSMMVTTHTDKADQCYMRKDSSVLLPLATLCSLLLSVASVAMCVCVQSQPTSPDVATSLPCSSLACDGKVVGSGNYCPFHNHLLIILLQNDNDKLWLAAALTLPLPSVCCRSYSVH